jgi:exodeoxyribonuclease III
VERERLRARATQLRAWLERERPDLVCLQELKAEERQIPDDCKLGDYHAFWHCRKAYSGVALWFEKPGPHPFRYTLTRRSTCNRARFR